MASISASIHGEVPLLLLDYPENGLCLTVRIGELDLTLYFREDPDAWIKFRQGLSRHDRYECWNKAPDGVTITDPELADQFVLAHYFKVKNELKRTPLNILAQQAEAAE
jgi:hypothetical protein